MADADSTRRCLHCGDAFEARINKTTGLPSKRARVYCGRACKRKAAWERHKAIPRPERARKPHVIVGVCAGCRTKFTRLRKGSVGGKADAGKYCSRECFNGIRVNIAIERRALQRIADNWKWTPSPIVIAESEALRRMARYVERPAKTLRPCRHCGEPTVGNMEYPRTCGECRSQLRREARRACKSRKKHKRVYRAKRRAIERGANADRIDPIKVFDRDGWRCQLCGCRTPKGLRGTYESDAPEMDHADRIPGATWPAPVDHATSPRVIAR